MSLPKKLDEFDQYAEAAIEQLVKFIEENREYLIIQARGRLVEGHWRYRDLNMYGMSPDELLTETSQEIADAINYMMLREQLISPANGGV